MLLKKNIDCQKLLEAVKSCAGEVMFLTRSDRIDLKSALCQYVFISAMNQPSMVEGASIECSDASDYDRLSRFLENSEAVKQ